MRTDVGKCLVLIAPAADRRTVGVSKHADLVRACVWSTHGCRANRHYGGRRSSLGSLCFPLSFALLFSFPSFREFGWAGTPSSGIPGHSVTLGFAQTQGGVVIQSSTVREQVWVHHGDVLQAQRIIGLRTLQDPDGRVLEPQREAHCGAAVAVPPRLVRVEGKLHARDRVARVADLPDVVLGQEHDHRAQHEHRRHHHPDGTQDVVIARQAHLPAEAIRLPVEEDAAADEEAEDEAARVCKIVQVRDEAEGHVHRRRERQNQHVEDRALDHLPVLQQLGPGCSKHAEDAAAGPNSDHSWHEDGGHQTAEQGRRQEDQGDLGRAVAGLQLDAEAAQRQHVDHEVNDASVHEHGGPEAPPLAVPEHLVILLGAAAQQRLR
eukprot:scaffold651_cov252-Pinguiococcus_pyrenoidosus.AAC.6